MDKIEKITIKSFSGYGPCDLSYYDKLVVTDNSISYEKFPMNESKENPKIKWAYRSNHPQFIEVFNQACLEVEKLFAIENMIYICDGTSYDITVTYDTKKRISEHFACDYEVYEPLFKAIKKLVPSLESIPDAIQTEEDWG